jgi:hypothetical protein
MGVNHICWQGGADGILRFPFRADAEKRNGNSTHIFELHLLIITAVDYTGKNIFYQVFEQAH